MYKSIAALLLTLSFLGASSDTALAGRKKKDKAKTEKGGSSSNLKESFRAIGHGFRDAGRSVGRDAKAATHAVRDSEKGKKKK